MPSLSWPPLGYETLPWTSRAELGTASRGQLRRHQGPYQAALVPEIVAAKLVLEGEAAAEAEEAASEIARFDADMGGEIAPFGSVLLRSESAASSQIENLTASARAIAEAEIGDPGRRNAAQIVANTRAMQAAIALADRLDGDSILRMHHALMESSEPAMAGRWRDEQNWIGGGALGPHGALFVPPHQRHIEPAVADLVAFMKRDDVPVLAHAAIVHAQFETIHPFVDGNGRTGRALLHAVLRNKRLTRNVTVPVSAGLLTDPAAYFDALTAYRTGDPSAIVRQLAAATFAAVANGRSLVAELRRIRDGWQDRVTARRDSATWRVAELLLRLPVLNAPVITRELGIIANNVHRYLQPLEQAGVLVEFTDRKRGRAWRSIEVLEALDAFAERAGRRRLNT